MAEGVQSESMSRESGHLLRFDDIVAALGDPVVAADSDNHIVYANPAIESLLGWSPDELVGRPLTVLIPPRFRPLHMRGFRRYIETRIPVLIGHPVHVPALRRDGTEVDIELRLSVVEASPGDLLFIATLHDIRERIELERQLALAGTLRATTEAAERLTTLLDLDDVLRVILDTLLHEFDAVLARVWLAQPESGTFILRRQAGEDMPPSVVKGSTIPEQELPTWLAHVVQTRRPFVSNDVAEIHDLPADWVARTGCVALAAFPLLSGGEMLGVLVDVSRRAIPQELADALHTFSTIAAMSLHDMRTLQQERASRERAEINQRRLAFLAEASTALAASLDYRSTLSSLADLAVSYLADWCIIDMIDEDGTVHRLQVAHRDPAKMDLVERLRQYEPRPGESQVQLRVLRTGKPMLIPRINDAMLRRSARNEEHLGLLLALQFNSYMSVPILVREQPAGVITFVSGQSSRTYDDDDLALAVDLAHRAGLAIENAMLYTEAREAGRLRDEFISTVSHDLKNPIAAIKGRAQILRRRIERMEIPDGERLREGLDSIDANATKMVRFINGLVDEARFRATHSFDLTLEPVNLGELVREVVHDARPAGPRHAFRVETGDDEIVGHWDCGKLERVIANIVNNAVKYSPDGGEISLQVGREETPDGTFAILSVQDQGLGIPDEDMAQIFERYHRGSNVSGSIPGSGIGLSSAREIVEQHGGTISVQSRQGDGSTFTIRLPLSGSRERATEDTPVR